ncbi:MAG: S41 family peptidase [Xanthomonadales bacterium]|nr:S41 family peptidase [Xanthomonadales bacterium]
MPPMLRLAWLCLCSPLLLHASPQPIRDSIGVIPEAQGFWRSAAQGWLLQISDAGIQRWQDTSAGCYATPPADADWPLMGQIEYTLIDFDADDSASFQYLPGDAATRFDRVEALPEHCGAEDLSDERSVFEVFVAIMDTHYAFFEPRGIDWPARVRQARPKVRAGMGEAALRQVLAGMLEGLNDSHTKLIGQVNGERFRIQDGQGQTLPRVRAEPGEQSWLQALVRQLLDEVLDEGAEQIGNERIIWGTIDGQVGYLQVFTMGGFSNAPEQPVSDWAAAELTELDALLDPIFSRFADTRGVIVDLSNNRGGYDAIARALAARFSDSPFDAYTVDTDRDSRAEHHYRIQPADGPRYTGPVIVLTSDVTVSGGEIATLALRALGNVTHAGGRTRGSFSTPLAKPLPNGWYLELSSETFADQQGRVWEATGIAPEREFEVFPADDPVAGHAHVLRELAAELAGKHE